MKKESMFNIHAEAGKKVNQRVHGIQKGYSRKVEKVFADGGKLARELLVPGDL